jgi:PAS domain S-box-containing protein
LVVSNKKSTIHVLHVDDDPTILEITKLMLQDLDSNLEIDNSCCVDDGIKKLSSKKYDVVVSDYEMPQKDGLQFLKELREKRNDIPFILFTGKGREEVAIKALNLGADGYYNKQGSPETVYGELTHGIRRSFEHQKTDELLRKSQEELKAIVNNAPIGIATSDSNMQFKSANEAFCRIVGYSEDELQKRSFRDITYPADVENSNKEMKELFCGNVPYFSQEKRYVRKDGNIIYGKVIVSAIRNDKGEPVLFVAELEDITQRKQAESELRETFNVLERVGEGIDAGLAVIGKDYSVVWANKRLMDLGVAPSKKCYETFNNLGAVCPDCGVEKIFKQNLSLDVHEYKTVNSKGEPTWIELRVTPLKDKEGNVTAALELAVPITERKKAEEALRISESHYRLLAENAKDVIWTGNLDGHFTYVSPSVLQLRGYTPEEVLKQSMLEALTPDSARIVSEALQESLETGVIPLNHLELEQPCKNGSTVWTEVSFSIVRDKTGNPQSVLGVSRDITTRKRMETKLQQSEEQFRQLFSTMPSAVAVYEAVDGGADFLFVDFNEKAENIEKIKKSNVVDQRVTEVFPGVKSFGIFSVFQRVWQSGKPEYYPEALYKDDKDQGTWRENWVYQLPNGNIVAIYNDITERKKAEEALREADYRLQKLATQTPGMLYQFKKSPDGTYCVPFTSEAIQNIFGCSPQDVREDFSPIAKVIVPEDLDRVISSIEYSAENLTPWTCKYRVKLPNQEIQWVWGQSTPEKLADGSIIWYGYNVDISEGKKIEDALT